MQEREDDVKTMNAMVQYSRTVAIRDAQLREKKLIARKKILEEKREGILMEIARIKQVSGSLCYILYMYMYIYICMYVCMYVCM